VPRGRQRLGQPHPARAVVRVNLGMGAHARVEQDHPLGVADGVTQAGLNSGRPCPGLLRWPYEVSEINALHCDVSHLAILATGARHDKGGDTAQSVPATDVLICRGPEELPTARA
jgi:hypothetical protein